MTQDFEVYLPLEKSQDPATGDWTLKGPLSSRRRDLQGDVMLHDALSKGLERFVELGMPVDWNHFSVTKGDPKWTIGEGLKLYDGPARGGGLTKWLDTQLLKGTPVADQVKQLKDAGKKLFYSVGGQILDRDGHLLKKVVVNHVAVTDRPANPDAVIGLEELAKCLGVAPAAPAAPAPHTKLSFYGLFDSFGTKRPGTLGKTLTAGAGPGLGSEGGRALVREEVEGARGGRRDPCKRRTRKTCKCAACTACATSTSRTSRNDSPKRRPLMKKHDLSALTDPDLDEGLDTLAKSENVELSTFASLMKSLKDGVVNLFKSADDDENEENDDDEPMGKTDSYLTNAGGQAAVDPEAFMETLVKRVDKRIVVRNQSLESKLEAKIDQVLAKNADLEKANLGLLSTVEALNKSVTEQQPVVKEMGEFLEAVGKRAQPQDMRKGGAYNVQTGQQGGGSRTKEHVLFLLEEGAKRNMVSGLQTSAFCLRGTVDETLLKSIEATLPSGALQQWAQPNQAAQ